MMSLRDQILEASDLATEVVPVPEWGCSVTVATMSGAARDEWEQSLVTRTGAVATVNTANVRARLVAATVVDESGARVFSADDISRLGTKSSAALDRVCKVAQRLNGLTAADLEDAKGN